MQIRAKRIKSRDVLPGERLAHWVTGVFDLETEPPTFEEIVQAHPSHTEAEVLAEIYQAINRHFLEIRYSGADQDIVYVRGVRLR